jgi:hypothetical protein
MSDTAWVEKRPLLCRNRDSLGPFRGWVLAPLNLSWRHLEVMVRIRKDRV